MPTDASRGWAAGAAFALAVLLAAAPASGAAQPEAAAVSLARLKADFFDAARLGRIDVMQAMLKAGAPIDARDERGFTALILAAYDNQPAMVDFLIAQGADPCLGDNRGDTALMGVAFQGYDAIAARLLKTRCDVDQTNHAGQTALMMAALFGRRAQVEMLIARGADPARQDGSGRTAAQVAAAQGQSALAARLAGADAR